MNSNSYPSRVLSNSTVTISRDAGGQIPRESLVITWVQQINRHAYSKTVVLEFWFYRKEKIGTFKQINYKYNIENFDSDNVIFCYDEE